MIINWVYDDEELLEMYEWQEDDTFEELSDLPVYHICTDVLHDFMYCQMTFMNRDNECFIVSDLHYVLVIEIKDHQIYRRGTLPYNEQDLIRKKVLLISKTSFKYQITQEAYEKEFGLTRKERMKKICLEEVIDEIFVTRYDIFIDICEQLNIYKENSSEQYLALKNKIEKGYSSLHELLYKELIQKN